MVSHLWKENALPLRDPASIPPQSLGLLGQETQQLQVTEDLGVRDLSLNPTLVPAVWCDMGNTLNPAEPQFLQLKMGICPRVADTLEELGWPPTVHRASSGSGPGRFSGSLQIVQDSHIIISAFKYIYFCHLI